MFDHWRRRGFNAIAPKSEEISELSWDVAEEAVRINNQPGKQVTTEAMWDGDHPVHFQVDALRFTFWLEMHCGMERWLGPRGSRWG